MPQLVNLYTLLALGTRHYQKDFALISHKKQGQKLQLLLTLIYKFTFVGLYVCTCRWSWAERVLGTEGRSWWWPQWWWWWGPPILTRWSTLLPYHNNKYLTFVQFTELYLFTNIIRQFSQLATCNSLIQFSNMKWTDFHCWGGGSHSLQTLRVLHPLVTWIDAGD